MWGALVGGLVSGFLGKKASDKASKRQSQAQASQLAFEKAQAERLNKMRQDQMNLANASLFGGMYNVPQQEGAGAVNSALIPSGGYSGYGQPVPGDISDPRNKNPGRRPGNFAAGGQYLSSAGFTPRTRNAQGRSLARSVAEPSSGRTFNFGRGSMATSQDWTQRYLDFLRNSPDITYNAQRGRLERDYRQGMNQAAQRMGLGRGAVSGNALRGVADMSIARAGALGNMEAGRFDRQGRNLGMGTQLAQGIVNRDLGMRSIAMGMPGQTSTAVPAMMMNQAAGYNQQGQAYGNLAGSLFNMWMQSRQNRTPMQFPTTVASAPAPVQTVPNQFDDFKFRPPANSRYAGYRRY